MSKQPLKLSAGKPLLHRGHELYKIPGEAKNLYGTDDHGRVRRSLEARLRKWIVEYDVQ